MAATDDRDRDDTPVASEDEVGDGAQVDTAADDEASDEVERLDLEVAVDTRGACERHITVTIPRKDIDRYFDKEFTELMDSAQVPGFRKGHAPTQVGRESFSEGCCRSGEGDVVVRRRGAGQRGRGSIADQRAGHQVGGDPASRRWSYDVRVQSGGASRLRSAPMEGSGDREAGQGLHPGRRPTPSCVACLPIAMVGWCPRTARHRRGDYVTTNLTFKYNDEVLTRAEEEVIRIRSVLSFRDGKIEEFAELMQGVKAGETREGVARLSQDAPNVLLRGKEVTAVFDVLEVKTLELPELTDELLDEIGGFEDEGDLRDNREG